MKKICIINLFGILFSLTSCVTPNQKVITSSLSDNLIAVAKEAQAAGASKVEYTANVVDTANGSAAVVVPVAPPVSLGFNRQRQVGTTVKVTIDVPKAAGKIPTKQKFSFDRNTAEAVPLN